MTFNFSSNGIEYESGGGEVNNQNKNITENGTYTADSGYTGLGTVNVNVPDMLNNLTSSIVEGNNPVDTTDLADAESDIADIIPYSESEPLTITATTSQQTITAPSDVGGYSPITVNAVTSAIDQNIRANNIKSGVSILGVQGNVEELNGTYFPGEKLTSEDGQVFSPRPGKNAILGMYVKPNNASLTITPSSSEQTFSVPSGYSGYGTVTCEASSGGGGADSGGRYLVQVIDYDGTILKQDHLNEGATFTLPDSPTHTGLTFQEWSSPVTITNGSFTVEHDTIIGAVYTTVSGKSEFDIKLTDKTGLEVQLNINGTKNWGDGTTDTNTSHTYTDYGEYTITCDGTSMPNTSNGIFNQVWNGNHWITDPLESNGKGRGVICTAARLAGGLTLQNYSFLCCDNMKYITIDNTIKASSFIYFNYSTHLKALIIPVNLAENSQSGFNLYIRCTPCLKYLVIPNGRTKGIYIYSDGSEGGCGVETMVFPPKTGLNVTSFSSYCLKRVCFDGIDFGQSTGMNLNYCTNYVDFLNDAKVPTYIGSKAQGVLEWRFKNYTSVPTLYRSEGLGTLAGINHFLKIYVPASLETAWKTETNWATYADYIVGV